MASVAMFFSICRVGCCGPAGDGFTGMRGRYHAMRAFHKRYFALGVSQASWPVRVSLGWGSCSYHHLSSARGHTLELEARSLLLRDALERALALLPLLASRNGDIPTTWVSRMKCSASGNSGGPTDRCGCAGMTEAPTSFPIWIPGRMELEAGLCPARKPERAIGLGTAAGISHSTVQFSKSWNDSYRFRNVTMSYFSNFATLR